MRINYNLSGAARKALVTAIAEELNLSVHYKGAPTFAYEDGGSAVSEFRPDKRLAVTIPTVDPHHGKLLGLAVQLPTLARDSDGNEFPLPHAEWSVRTVWP